MKGAKTCGESYASEASPFAKPSYAFPQLCLPAFPTLPLILPFSLCLVLATGSLRLLLARRRSRCQHFF